MSGVSGGAAIATAAGSVAQGASSGKKGGDGEGAGGTGVLPPILDATKYFSPGELKKAARVADPMMRERGRYIKQLRRLMRKPENILKDPMFKARMKAGQDIVTSSAAARGLLGSGNLAAELQAEGQRIGADEMDKQFQRLALLSGAQTGSPGEAGGILGGKHIPGGLFSPTVVPGQNVPGGGGGPDFGLIGEGIGGLIGPVSQLFGGGNQQQQRPAFPTTVMA